MNGFFEHPSDPDIGPGMFLIESPLKNLAPLVRVRALL